MSNYQVRKLNSARKKSFMEKQDNLKNCTENELLLCTIILFNKLFCVLRQFFITHSEIHLKMRRKDSDLRLDLSEWSVSLQPNLHKNLRKKEEMDKKTKLSSYFWVIK